MRFIKKIKRLGMVIFIAGMLGCFFQMSVSAEVPEMIIPEDALASGVVDEDYGQIVWVIDKDGKLTVNGTGDVRDPDDTSSYAYEQIPWYGFSEIYTAEINVTGMTNASYLFFGCRDLESIDLSNFDTSQVKNMSHMFHIEKFLIDYEYGQLKELDLSNFDTSQVTDMSYMFYDCRDLESLDLSSFDTSQVTNMKEMFGDCRSLKSLDLSGFDISKVENMTYMLSWCESLEEIITPANCSVEVGLPFREDAVWKMSDGTVVQYLPQNSESSTLLKMMPVIANGRINKSYGNITWIIDENYKLTVTGTGDVAEKRDQHSFYSKIPWYSYRSYIESVDISVTEMTDASYLFAGCNYLEKIDVSQFDTSKVTNMQCMFWGCSSLDNPDLSSMEVWNVGNMRGMFRGCSSLRTLDISSFDTLRLMYTGYYDSSTGEISNGMFQDCSNLESLNLGEFYIGGLSDVSGMFQGCSSLKNLDLSGFCADRIWKMASMFEGCSSLETLDLSGFQTSEVFAMPKVFRGCSSLEKVDLSSFDTSAVDDMSKMFLGCSSLKTLDLSEFDTSAVEDMSNMFAYCSSLESLDLSKFDTSVLVNMNGMFMNCNSLKTLNLSGIDTSGVYYMTELFKGCNSLKTLDLSGFETRQTDKMAEMFYDCSSLENLNLSNFETRQVSDMRAMFYGCSSLEWLDLKNFDTRNVSNMEAMFYNCDSLKKLDLSNFKTSNVEDMSNMFAYCSSLESLDLSGFDVSNVTSDSRYMFSGCSSLSEIATPYKVGVYTYIMLPSEEGYAWQMPDGIFIGYFPTNLTHSIIVKRVIPAREITLDKENIVLAKNESVMVTAIIEPENTTDKTVVWTVEDENVATVDQGLITGISDGVTVVTATCGNTVVSVSVIVSEEIIVGGVINQTYGQITWMIDRDGKLTVNGTGDVRYPGTLDIPWIEYNDIIKSAEIDVVSMTDASDLFYGCTALTDLNLSGFDTSQVTTMSCMFYECNSLKSLDLSGFDTSQVTTMSAMFYECDSLESLNLSSWDMSQVIDTFIMFEGCNSLKKIETPFATNQAEWVQLPNAAWYYAWQMSDGTIISYFPTNLEESVGIKRALSVPITDIFYDVPEEKWYSDYVKIVFERGLMTGSGEKFNPEKNITRAQFVTILYRMAGEPEVIDYSACEKFSDVLKEKYYTNAICWAYNTGITTGKNGIFDIDGKLTRQQMTTFLLRFANIMGCPTDEREDYSSMLNADKVSSYAVEAVSWAVGSGLISGSKKIDSFGNTVYDLNPEGSTSRAQIATILVRFCENYEL